MGVQNERGEGLRVKCADIGCQKFSEEKGKVGVWMARKGWMKVVKEGCRPGSGIKVEDYQARLVGCCHAGYAGKGKSQGIGMRLVQIEANLDGVEQDLLVYNRIVMVLVSSGMSEVLMSFKGSHKCPLWCSYCP